ncbi:MAG TPA: neocarzinostatin apoprotein domain-containing protein [Acidimicrobiales bacterium]|jgi:hypothetical protein|nr:neocarzinostatin apoprotein domain-containing protein [Acidimicrobiales bacterium]
MLIVLVALVAVVVAVVALGGGAALGMGDGRRRGGLASILPGLALLGVFVVIGLTVLAAVVLFGVRGGGEDPGAASGEPRGGTPTSSSTTTAAPPASDGAPATVPGRRGGAPAYGPDVRVAAWAEDEFVPAAEVVDELADATVLRVSASGFVADTTGEAAQCTAARAGREACRDRFPVRFDGRGTARFQYLVSADRCDRGAPCLLWVRGEDDRRVAVALVFGARAPEAATLTVAPDGGLEDGQTVRVSVAGVSPRSRLDVVQCAPPGLPVAERCDTSPRESPLVVGPDGRGSTTFTVSAGEVGTGRHPCRRGNRCGIGLVSDGALVRSAFMPVRFSAGASASYDAKRMALGSAAAVVLLSLAFWLVRTTDWREPTEAATPAMDAVPLTEP